MSLYKNFVTIPFRGGINTKVSEKLLPNGSFLDLQNTVRRKDGALEKRYGFTSISNLTTAEVEFTSGSRLDTFFNDFLMVSSGNLYSYSPSIDRWSSRGKLLPIVLDNQQIVRNNDVQATPDAAVLDGIEVYAWGDSRGGIRCSVVDRETGAFLIADQEVNSSGSRPRVVKVGMSTIVITYLHSGALKCRRIVIGNPTVLQTEQTIETGMASQPYDVVSFNNQAIFAYNTSTNVLRIGYLLSSGAVGSSGSNGYPDPVNLTVEGRNAVNLTVDEANGLIYLFFHDSAGASADDLVCKVYDSVLAALDTDDVESSIADVCNICGSADSTGLVRVFYEITGASRDTHFIRSNTVQYSGGSSTVGTSAVFKRSVGLASKPVVVSDVHYVICAHESTLQSTYFMVDHLGNIVSKMQASKARGLSQTTVGILRSELPRISLSGSYYVVPLAVRNRLNTLNSTTASGFVGISSEHITFNSFEFDSGQLGRNLHFAGGVLQGYDGASVVEHGFHLYPEEGFSLAADTSGSLNDESTYRVKLVYEWVDNQGQIHRSAPSVAEDINLAAGEDSITVTAPTLRLTGKNRVKIVAYRTEADEVLVFYRDNEVVNDPTTDTVTISLTRSDTSLNVREILYTVGGTLDNIAPPSCKVVHAHKSRLWLAGTEDDNLWYSRAFVEGEGVNFSDGLLVKFPDATALSSLDDKLVIFREDSVYTFSGEGPLDTGQQNDYGDPQLVSGDVGCTNQKSIAITPLGVIFKSAKGIYLLDRALNTQYIGDRVEDYNDLTISSAVVLADNNEVRFTTSEGVCLVYNYYFNEWSTFTNYEAESAVVGLDTYCHLKADGSVHKEVNGSYNDNNIKYSMKIETNWMQFNRIQGFQRVYRWALLGDYVNPCKCRVKLAYDFENVYNETVYFDTQVSLSTNVYGDDVYGETSVYGSNGSQVFQFRSKPYRQKCQAIKLLIEDIDFYESLGGASFKLVDAAFEVGNKTGIKLGESKTRGS